MPAADAIRYASTLLECSLFCAWRWKNKEKDTERKRERESRESLRPAAASLSSLSSLATQDPGNQGHRSVQPSLFLSDFFSLRPLPAPLPCPLSVIKKRRQEIIIVPFPSFPPVCRSGQNVRTELRNSADERKPLFPQSSCPAIPPSLLHNYIVHTSRTEVLFLLVLVLQESSHPAFSDWWILMESKLFLPRPITWKCLFVLFLRFTV